MQQINIETKNLIKMIGVQDNISYSGKEEGENGINEKRK